MAMGKALVSTSIGAEGLDVQSGRDLVLADDAAAISQAINLLLRDAAVRRGYEEAAAKLAAQYDWSHIEKRFTEVLHAAICERAQNIPTRDTLAKKP
jgi:glycosyltransferase involved in cell wall biosynthesis